MVPLLGLSPPGPIAPLFGNTMASWMDKKPWKRSTAEVRDLAAGREAHVGLARHR